METAIMERSLVVTQPREPRDLSRYSSHSGIVRSRPRRDIWAWSRTSQMRPVTIWD